MEQNNKKKQKCGSIKRKEHNKKCLDAIATKSRKLENYFSTTLTDTNSDKTLSNTIIQLQSPTLTKNIIDTNFKTLQTGEITKPSETHNIFECIELTTTHTKHVNVELPNIKIDEQINFNYFVKPHGKENIKIFFSFHPNQPEKKLNGTPLPFNTSKVYYVNTIIQGVQNKIKRNWITFSHNHNSLFCSICLVYSLKNSIFTNTNGYEDWSHVYDRIKEHEDSKNHREASKSYMSDQCGNSIDGLFNKVQWNQREYEVMKRRKIAETIVEIVKVIGKQGLPFRGFRYEAAYNLNNTAVNHGNFLEMVLLMAKSNIELNDHINKAIVESEKRLNTGKSGRGNLFTFLSPTTITNVIQSICELLLLKISEEVKVADIYSITMDTTMDVSSHDQCVIVLRYIKEIIDCGKSSIKVVERVIALKKVVSSSGQGLFDLLKVTLNSINISFNKCVADSFDGAANMNGHYQGVQAKIKEVLPKHIHTWCYAHVLNLVLQQTTSCSITVISFFGLLQELFVFFKESYKRFNVYENQNNPNHRSHLINIGTTRWRSKNDAVMKIFGRIGMWQNENKFEDRKNFIYVQIVFALHEISLSNDFATNVRCTARSLLNRLTRYETTLTAMMFLQIFKFTTALSDYLQTSNLDYVQAWRKIDITIRSLKENQREFLPITTAAKLFSVFTSEIIWKNETEIDIELELPQKRRIIIPRRSGENLKDIKEIDTPENSYKIKTFNNVMDNIITCLENRFSGSKELYGDLELFDPRRFKEIAQNGIHDDSMNKICELLPHIDKHTLVEQLLSFAKFWPKISKTNIKDVDDIYQINSHDSDFEDFDYMQEDHKLICTSKNKCNSCLLCVINVISEFNMYSLEYKELFGVYKFLLTIPLTQVTCERSFSKLKIIKTRLRSCLAQDNLESLFLMNCERELLVDITPSQVIDLMCEKSTEMKRLLNV